MHWLQKCIDIQLPIQYHCLHSSNTPPQLTAVPMTILKSACIEVPGIRGHYGTGPDHLVNLINFCTSSTWPSTLKVAMIIPVWQTRKRRTRNLFCYRLNFTDTSRKFFQTDRAYPVTKAAYRICFWKTDFFPKTSTWLLPLQWNECGIYSIVSHPSYGISFSKRQETRSALLVESAEKGFSAAFDTMLASR